MTQFKMGGKKTAEQLLDEALKAFATAQQKVETAVTEVDKQIKVNEDKVVELNAQIAADVSVRERLERVRDRVIEFIS